METSSIQSHQHYFATNGLPVAPPFFCFECIKKSKSLLFIGGVPTVVNHFIPNHVRCFGNYFPLCNCRGAQLKNFQFFLPTSTYQHHPYFVKVLKKSDPTYYCHPHPPPPPTSKRGSAFLKMELP